MLDCSGEATTAKREFGVVGPGDDGIALAGAAEQGSRGDLRCRVMPPGARTHDPARQTWVMDADTT